MAILDDCQWNKKVMCVNLWSKWYSMWNNCINNRFLSLLEPEHILRLGVLGTGIADRQVMWENVLEAADQPEPRISNRMAQVGTVFVLLYLSKIFVQILNDQKVVPFPSFSRVNLLVRRIGICQCGIESIILLWMCPIGSSTRHRSCIQYVLRGLATTLLALAKQCSIFFKFFKSDEGGRMTPNSVCPEIKYLRVSIKVLSPTLRPHDIPNMVDNNYKRRCVSKSGKSGWW